MERDWKAGTCSAIRAVGVCSAAVAATLIFTLSAAGLQAPTKLTTPSGKSLGMIVPYSRDQWTYGASEECYVWFSNGEYDVMLTHNDVGAAIRAGANRWAVWTGPQFRGYIRLQTRAHATLTKRGGGGRVIAIARGPDPVAAGAAYLALGVCS